MKSESLIQHADVYGTRKSKYDLLRSSDLNSIDWQTLSPNAPFYLFRPQEQELREEYELDSWRITEVFPTNAVGFQTHRDYLVLDPSRETLLARMKDFANVNNTDEEVRAHYFGHIQSGKYPPGDTVDFNLTKSRQVLASIADLNDWIVPCIRRPFDYQWYFHHPVMVDRGRYNVQNQLMQHKNRALLWTRPMAPTYEFSVMCSSCAVDQSAVGNKMAGAGGTYAAPLYMFPTDNNLDYEREANLAPAFVQAVAGRIGETPTPEAIFHYAYAVFHAPTYRTRYAPFLKIDFPRLPLPADADTFSALAALGAKLTALHLLEAPQLQKTGIAYPVGGSHVVEKRPVLKRYAPPTSEGQPGRVWLNDTEYFDNVPLAAWEFRVGGYQPAFKWLDDRAGRVLTTDDITHYRRMLAALRETVSLLPDVDAAFLRLLAA